MKKMSLFLLSMIYICSNAQNTLSWVKSYTGTVGKTAFTMHLHKAGADYDATVYYNNVEQPYELAAQNQKTATITLSGASTNNLPEEKWVLKIAGTKLSGTFTMNKKSVPVAATERSFEPGITYVYTEKKEALSKDKGAPTATFYGASIWYNNNPSKNKLLWPGCSTTAGKCLLGQRDKFMKDFREENKGVKPADYKDGSYMFSKETQTKILLRYVSQNLLVFSANTYEYMGGAHGMYGSSHQVIDMRYEKNLALTDFISDTSALAPIIEKNYRKQYQVEANTSLEESGLFYNSIPANDNFFLTQKCLGFTYNPYEIGPYAAGQFTIYIPYDDFKHLIKEEAKSIFSDKK